LLALLSAQPARWEEVERSTLVLDATVWFGPFVIHQKNQAAAILAFSHLIVLGR
jgi:hypothetical protein